MIAAGAEIVLLLLCGVVLQRSRRLPGHGFAWVTAGMLAFLPAVVIGAIEYAGFPDLHPWHQRASDLGAALGMPVLMIGFAASAQRSLFARRALQSLVLLLPLGMLLDRLRMPGQAVLILSVVALGVACRGQRGLLPLWAVMVLLLAGAMTALYFRQSHGDVFEALFHVLLGGFLLVAARLSVLLAGRPGTGPGSDRSSA